MDEVIDFNSTNLLGDKFVSLIDAAIDRAKEAPRNYLGASAIGEPCKRRLQYDYTGAKQNDGSGFSPKTRRIFRRGHEAEEWIIGWIRDAGFTLKTKGRDGKQFGFSDCDDRFKGHVDGVIVDGPQGFRYPALFEAKCLGAKGYAQLVKHGVAKAYPKYAAQVAVYQAYLQLAEHPAVFVALNADTCDIHVEFVPFNQVLAQENIDKAAQVLEATSHGEVMPRVTDDPDSFSCKFCPYSELCWS